MLSNIFNRAVAIFPRTHRVTMSSASGQASVFEEPRIVVKKLLARAQREGDGAVVRRSIGR